ncbi:MAG: restriction endonuclease subunit S [Sediminibacterium sp.]|uniref:restriction endonuclease subunit S n=1 Tax=Flavobacterium sp. TaxID=239 RepID=UPI0032643828
MTETKNINQLPRGWKWVKLGDVCEKMSNGANAKQSDDKIGFPISRIETIWNETIDLDRVKYISETDVAFVEKYSLKKDDILFSHINSDVHLGKTAIFKNQTKTLIHGINLLLIRLNQNASPDFFNYQFKFKRRRGEFINIAQKSVNQSSINQPKLKNLDFVLPPKHAQLAIVSKIEELFGELDKGIENLRSAQQQLKTYRQAVLKWAFEGKLNNENVKEGELPEGWKYSKLGEYIEDISSGKSYRCDERPPQKDEVGIVKVSSVTWGFFSEMESKTCFSKDFFNAKYLIKKGDFLFSRANTIEFIGACVIVQTVEKKVMLSDKILRLTFTNEVSKEYVLYYLRSRKGRKQIETLSTGNQDSMRNIGQEKIRQIEFPHCSSKDQNNVVQAIETRLSVADKMEESITHSLQQAEALRQSILKRAFEGRLVSELEQQETGSKGIPIERKVLAGKIIHLLHDDKYFGLTKFQKTFFVAEHFAEVEYETDYLQERAGPYDREFTRAFRKEMIEKDWFSEETKISMTHFTPGENVGKLIKDYPKYFRNKGSKITFVLKLFKDKTLFEAELIATLYAVWNNRIISRQSISGSLLMGDIYRWSAEKKKYNENQITSMYEWMKTVKLIPTGFGKIIKLDTEIKIK